MRFMVINILQNIAYLFYPKNVTYKNNAVFYANTQEHKKLIEILDSVRKNYQDYAREIWATIEEASLFRKLYKADLTNLNMLDRCFNFQLIDFDHEKNIQYSICLNLSFLVLCKLFEFYSQWL